MITTQERVVMMMMMMMMHVHFDLLYIHLMFSGVTTGGIGGACLMGTSSRFLCSSNSF